MKVRIKQIAFIVFFLMGSLSSMYLVYMRSSMHSPQIKTQNTLQWSESKKNDAMLPDWRPDGKLLDALIQSIFNGLPQEK